MFARIRRLRSWHEMMALASLAQPNMNGPYVYSTTPGGTPGKLPAQYSDWPGGVESFDVLTPPMTTASQSLRHLDASNT